MTGKRRPVVYDKAVVVFKRLRFVRHVLRPVFYGVAPAPCWGDVKKQWKNYYCREFQWAWLIRDMVRDGSFYYVEILRLAEEYAASSRMLPLPSALDDATMLAWDLSLLKGFETYLHEKRREWKVWERDGYAATRRPFEKQMRIAKDQAKEMRLTGLCPFCGEDLPCLLHDEPLVEKDGRGGLRVAV